MTQNFLRWPLLDDFAAIHDKDARGKTRHDAEVVGDEDHGHAEAFFQRGKQLHDLRLDGDIERGGRFVGNKDVGLTGQRHGDHDALLHAAAQLMRVIVHALGRIDDADRIEPAHHLGIDIGDIGTVQTHGLGNLAAHGVNRIERRARILENVGDLAAAQFAQLRRVHGEDILSVEKNFAAFDVGRRNRQQSREGERGDTFAAAAFADDGQRLARPEFEGRAFDRLDGAVLENEIDAEIADLEEWFAHWRSDRVSTAWRRASPVR